MSIESQSTGQDSLVGPTHGVIAIESMQLRGLGLSATVQLGRQDGPGYFPAKISMTSMGRMPADKRLVVRFQTDPSGESPSTNGLTIDVPITIPQGARSISKIRYLPKWTLGQTQVVSIYADGRLLDDSATRIGSPQAVQRLQFQSNNWGTQSPINLVTAGFRRQVRLDCLFIDVRDQADLASVPDVKSILIDSPNVEYSWKDEPVSTGVEILLGDMYTAIGQSELATDWRGYQLFDLLLMSWPAQQRLALGMETTEAIRQWVLQGGVTVIYGAPDLSSVLSHWEFRSAPDSIVDKTLRAMANNRDRATVLLKDTAEEMIALLEQGEAVDLSEKYVQAQKVGRWSVGMIPDLTNTESSLKYYRSLIKQASGVGNIESSEIANRIGVQPVGAGYVISIHRPDLVAQVGSEKPAERGSDTASNDQDLPTELELLFVKRFVQLRCSPMIRQGTEPLRGNDRFRKWTIPGVLQPPVYSFIGFLTVFVILVGPVAYLHTSRYGRSHLMFAIAPVLALITTAAMLGYGLVADGFATRTRIRQLTWVDGSSGHAGERTLATYFAGIRPSSGLSFPGHASVMRQAEASGLNWQQQNEMAPGVLGSIVIRPDAQVFDSSFLPSRDQRQFVVHAPRVDLGGLAIQVESGAGTNRSDAAAEVASAFEFPLERAIMRDGTGRYWAIDRLAPQSTVDGRAIDNKTASKQLAAMYNDYRPVASHGGGTMDENQRLSFDPLESIAISMGINPGYLVGYFEDWLRLHLQLTGELPPNHFVAIAPVSQDAIAVPGSELVGSVRYVFGTLQ